MKGFGLLETIVALGLFSVIASAGILGFIPALQLGRTGREQTQAAALSQEGLEAVRSIRDRSFANLSSGTFGIGISNSLWTFSGTSDISDKYTRQIIISPANRDAGGTLVVSGGSTDPDTFAVTSKTFWNNTVGDTRTISLNSYFTNWRKSTGLSYDSLIVYDRGTSTTPIWRTYTTSSNVFGSATTMPAITGRMSNIVLRTSPQKTEAILGIGNSSGTLYVYCFDGTNWSQDWSATVGGTGATRRFDIAYENTTGNAVVLYSTNVATTNELNFRKKLGSAGCGSANWGSATAFDPTKTSGLISWVKMTSSPVAGSNLIAALWIDWTKQLSGAIWNGTTFQNEMTSVGDTKVESINTGTSFPDAEPIDLAYESVTGDLMTIWGTYTVTSAVNGVRYRLCTGNSSSCTWGSVTTPPTFTADATNIDLSPNPNTDEMVFGSIGNQASVLQIGYWSGVGWTDTASVDTSSQAPLAGTKLVATGWLNSGATARSVVVYNDSGATNIGWYVGNKGVFTLQTDVGVTPVFVSPQKWYEVYNNPKSKDQLMFVVSDNSSNLYSKRLVMNVGATFTWTNADGGVAIGNSLSQSIVKPFGYAWWQK